MDWAQDNAGISESSYEHVFKYAPRESAVVSMLAGSQAHASVMTLKSDEEWISFCEKLPSPKRHESGLILLLARQQGECEVSVPGPPSSLTDWHQKISAIIAPRSKLQKVEYFATLPEKSSTLDDVTKITSAPPRREVRTLPFSQKTFRCISHAFHTHGSIARAISRSDVPVFSCEEAIMKELAVVYNVRTSNAWEGDLAMSATFFPKTNLTFAIVYGCSLSIEHEIVFRLSLIKQTQIHPLIVPAILVELERSRHARLVKSQMTKLELRMLESRFNPDDLERPARVNVGEYNEAKRSALLDAAYLKNGLSTWMRQISKMNQHAQELDELASTWHGDSHDSFSENAQDTRKLELSSGKLARGRAVGDSFGEDSARETTFVHGETSCKEAQQARPQRRKKNGRERDETTKAKVSDHRTEVTSEEATQGPEQDKKLFPELIDGSVNGLGYHEKEPQYGDHACQEMKSCEGCKTDSLRKRSAFGKKIRGRLCDIRDEYQDWVRDCDMRVDGLALAAQWVRDKILVPVSLDPNVDTDAEQTQGETSVEIALSTRQDSRYMRSIAIVTMIFLPGTWLAGVFSMTFFDWHSDDRAANVSEYVWIYALMTLILTAFTAGSWYFVTIYRPRQLLKVLHKDE
ncbi:hypothetical protein FSARC_570 [Fusarium sarcochroum]|uniref:Uncharacterized protein n=1 Tax=Fusarium sarcochroum TaxID=1208366 RepID=A0A8H4XFA4_9HYPO|nr:hypothetical protein FSARC_570 [Fusarium sarcochroum]